MLKNHVFRYLRSAEQTQFRQHIRTITFQCAWRGILYKMKVPLEPGILRIAKGGSYLGMRMGKLMTGICVHLYIH